MLPEYTVIIETGEKGYSAYIEELDGCVAAAQTEEGVNELILEAVQMHLEALHPGQEVGPLSWKGDLNGTERKITTAISLVRATDYEFRYTLADDSLSVQRVMS